MSATQREGHPLFAGAIHGVRAWDLVIRAGEVRLGAAYNGDAWNGGGDATRAACSEGPRRRPHRAPDERCTCGLYAWHTGNSTGRVHLEGAEDGERVMGIVEAWGRVVVHGDGFRAEFARPHTLVLPDDARGSDYELTVRRLAERHRAEVLVVGSFAQLARHCSERGLGLSDRAVTELLPRGDEPGEGESSPVAAHHAEPDSWVRIVLGFVGAVAGVIFGLMAVLVVAGLLIGVGRALWGTEAADRSSAPAPRARQLELVETRFSRTEDALIYIATVRNTARDHAAVGVRLAGRLVVGDVRVAGLHSPRTGQPEVSIPPEKTGAVVGWIRLTGERRERIEGLKSSRIESSRLADHGRAPVDAGLVPRVGAPLFDSETCAVSARVSGSSEIAAQRVQIVAFDGERPEWGARVQAGPFGPRPIRQVLDRVAPRPCADPATARLRLEVYPNPTSRQLRAMERASE